MATMNNPKINIRFKATKSYKKHIKSKKRYVISQGASRSGKSYSIAQIMVLKALERKRIITIVMEFMPGITATILRDLYSILKDIDVKDAAGNEIKFYVYNKSKHIFHFFNGSIIELRAFNNDENRVLGGSRDILWLDEADNIPFEVFSQLEIRCSEQVFISYNPRSIFWVNTEIMDLPEYKDEYDFVHTTYIDNRFCPPQQIESIKRRAARNENWKKVYLLGEVGAKLDLVYEKYNTIEYIPESITSKYIQYVGLDFGWTDPTALVECYIIPDSKGNIDEIYLNELLYLPEMSNRNLKNHINLHTLNRYICIADSANPQNIDELKRYGINIYGVKKGPDSINYGISLLREAKIYITQNSRNLLTEIKNYSYMKDKNDNYILDKKGQQIPVDDFNHCFIYDTYVETINGKKKIGDIEIGDIVLTDGGYRKVENHFNQGEKDVYSFTFTLDKDRYFRYNIISTIDHKIKCNNKWTEINKVKKGDKLWINKSLMVNPTTYTKMKNTFQKVIKDCTELSGSTITDKYQMVITYITLMVIHSIIKLKTWRSLKKVSTYLNIVKSGIQKIKKKVINIWPILGDLQKPGTKLTNQKKSKEKIVKSGGQKTGTYLEKVYVNVVAKYIKKVDGFKDFVVSNVKQNKEGLMELIMRTENASIVITYLSQTNIVKVNVVRQVVVSDTEKEYQGRQMTYDISVNEYHNFFANDILVHNCMDAARYVCLYYVDEKLRKSKKANIPTPQKRGLVVY